VYAYPPGFFRAVPGRHEVTWLVVFLLEPPFRNRIDLLRKRADLSRTVRQGKTGPDADGITTAVEWRRSFSVQGPPVPLLPSLISDRINH
jgi:hypothetical protein